MKKNAGIRAGVAGVMAALGAWLPSGALACSCAFPEATPFFDEQERIVVARVKRVSLERSQDGQTYRWANVEVLDTIRSTTGEPLVRVYTPADEAACGVSLVAGRDYLMSPIPGRGGKLTLCSSFDLRGVHDFVPPLVADLRRLRDERREGVPVRVRIAPAKGPAVPASTPTSTTSSNQPVTPLR